MGNFIRSISGISLVLAVIALIVALSGLLLSGSPENLIQGRVLENASLVTSRGIEYRAKIAIVDKLGREQWVWVAIPERDAKELPYGSWLIVDLNEEGYRIVDIGEVR